MSVSFLPLLRPPSSTLFPYRRSSDLTQALGTAMMLAAVRGGSADALLAELQESQPEMLAWLQRSLSIMRSEEHTSELQSHSDLVCRLLLEKKKKNKARSKVLEAKNST